MKYISISNYLNILGLTHFNSVARIGDCFTTFAMTEIRSRMGKSCICHCAKYLSLSALLRNLKTLRLLRFTRNDRFRTYPLSCDCFALLAMTDLGLTHCEGQYNRGISRRKLEY